ncbi:MAG: DNA-binding transcriptional regulator [Planctomycetota bacterium]
MNRLFHQLLQTMPQPRSFHTNPQQRRNVALLVESSRSYGRSVLRGIARFARTLGNWSIFHEEMTIDVPVPAWMQGSKLDGVIARVDDPIVDSLRELGTPIVDVRCRHVYPNIPQVETDDRRVAALAFEHLWQRGFRRFAFPGYQGAHYSENRLTHFRSFVNDAGCPLSVYEVTNENSYFITGIEKGGVADLSEFTTWLSSLTPPTGLFACNDIRGQQVLNACRQIDVNVPDDVAVIGVDDDDTVCSLSDPPLSSIRPDAEEVGFRAAQLLESMMRGNALERHIDYVPPAGVTQRLSTQVSAVDDRLVAQACRFIRENITHGINVQSVVEHVNVSRRQLERRFRESLGRTPHEELTAIQIEKVKQLLIESELSLERLAPLAGYAHKEQLAAVFKRETQETPGAFRVRNRKQDG